jgi:anti-anti-sigma factor
MDLLIKNYEKNVCVLKPVVNNKRNIESIIAKIKMIIFNNTELEIVVDLRAVNFLDSIKIGIVIGTYHFLEFSGKKIRVLVNSNEVQKTITNMSFENIEVIAEYSEPALAGIA